MERKSKRDHKHFTIYQLAKAINMPHSILVKLMHPDITKRVKNPRIETLVKIVGFFKQDGFNITVDDLLSGLKKTAAVQVNEQNIGDQIAKSITVYSFDVKLKKSIGMIDVNLMSNSENIIALLSDEDIKPMFKKNSFFVVDTTLKPEDDTLVAIKVGGYDKILIRKYYVEGHKKILKSYDRNIAPIELMPTNNYQVIGVVIQVNAKT